MSAQIPLFYQPDISEKSYAPTLTLDESRHIVRVMRLQQGDSIRVTDGKGNLYTGILGSLTSERCVFEIVSHHFLPKKDYSIHIAIAPTKNINRMEWFVEKSVEIGVDVFSFIQCRNSERKFINLDRLIKKAISAMKQSYQARLPSFNPIQPFTHVLTEKSSKFIAHLDAETHTGLLQHIAKPKTECLVLIGPEGGFTDDELAAARQNGCQSVCLGANRMRTETAGLVACNTLNLINL